MIKLDTDFGALFMRSEEISAVMPEKGRESCAVIYSQTFPDGISVNNSTEEVVNMILEAEFEIEIEIDDAEED